MQKEGNAVINACHILLALEDWLSKKVDAPTRGDGGYCHIILPFPVANGPSPVAGDQPRARYSGLGPHPRSPHLQQQNEVLAFK